MYYGLFGATWAVAGALGPIVGGAFTTNVTWRWCFYLNRMFNLHQMLPPFFFPNMKFLYLQSPSAASPS